MKKFLSWFLCFALVCSISVFPLSAQAIPLSEVGTVVWEEHFESKDSLSNWKSSGASLTQKEEALQISLYAVTAAVSSTEYPFSVLAPDRMGLSFQLWVDTPENITALSLVLTDEAGLTATYILDLQRLTAGKFTRYILRMDQPTSVQEGYNETAEKIELRFTTSAACNLRLDSMAFVMYDNAQWSWWLYDHEIDPADYAIAVLPDLQNTNYYFPDKMNAMMQWIADNAERENIQFTIDLGDITWNGYKGAQDENAIVEYERSDASFAILDKAGMDYSISYGNHDYTPYTPPNTTLFNTYFPINRFSTMESFGGAMEADKSDNTYYTFRAGRIQYLVLSLEFGPRADTLAWGNEVIASHPGHNVIIVTHAYLNGNREQIHTPKVWTDLAKKHKNVFMILCGHDRGQGYIASRQDQGDHNNTVYQYMINMQDVDIGLGVTPLLMMRFSNGGNTINFHFFDPTTGYAYQAENQFEITLPEGQLITATDVAQQSIDALPETITPENAEIVAAAFDAYHTLTEAEKAQITGTDKLNAAWEALCESMTDEEVAQQTTDRIDAIDPQAPDADTARIARAAYDSLNDVQKALVPNLTKLQAAEKLLSLVYGDTNRDGAINAGDALLALQHSVKLTTLTDGAFTAADVDGSNSVDATDALLILQKSVKLIDTFPIEQIPG